MPRGEPGPVGDGWAAWDAERKRRWHDRYLMRTYGIGLDEYEALLDKQGGKCAICEATEARGRGGRFHVDHDHATGAVRGLLCYSCNITLGHVRDNPATLERMIAYVQAQTVMVK